MAAVQMPGDAPHGLRHLLGTREREFGVRTLGG